jgi:acetyl esterase/lipase
MKAKDETMRRITLLLLAMGWAGHSAQAAEPANLTFDTYSGYFVSNKFEPNATESFLVISDEKRFDEVFGVAFVMGDKSHWLPKDAFKSNIVVAAIKRGKAIWEYKVERVTEAKGVVELRYTTTSKKSDSATFACPLIVSILKGKYTAIQFVENGKREIQPDLPYAERQNERQTLDVHAPTTGRSHPIIFWIHGGGWQAGDKTDVQVKPQAFVDKGFVFISTNYRLLPTVTIKQMAGDIAKAIRWVHDHAGQYGGDPTRIFVMGHSAGAQLAALLCTDDRYLKVEGLSLSIVRGCVPVDGDTYDVPMQIRAVEKRIADIYRRKFGDEASQKDLSPVTHVSKGKSIPPFLILHVAEHPETKAQSQRLATALQEAGISARAFPAEGKNHTTINTDLGLPGDNPTQALFEFLGKSLGTASGAEVRHVFLFSYFRGNGEDGLHLASSRDGYLWTALNHGRSLLAPQVGSKLMRDACLVQGPDGMFHMVWTTGWGDRVIGYASSRDLVQWSPQQAIPVMMHEPAARNAWAPELFYDEDQKQFLIFWATTIPRRFPETDRSGDNGWNHRIYSTTTRDFKTFAPTRLFFDGGFNAIDATILKARGQYYLIVKDETKTPVKKNLRIARSAKAEGPYLDVSAPISISWVEGPSAIQVGDEFLVYFDHYTKPQYYGALRSQDLVHWEDVSKSVSFPPGTRHGTVLRVSEEVVTRLQ